MPPAFFLWAGRQSSSTYKCTNVHKDFKKWQILVLDFCFHSCLRYFKASLPHTTVTKARRTFCSWIGKWWSLSQIILPFQTISDKFPVHTTLSPLHVRNLLYREVSTRFITIQEAFIRSFHFLFSTMHCLQGI